MTRKALLIGINKYRVSGADLRGCVNDVENMSRVLMDFYGFSDRGITTLTDLDATTEAIITSIERLIGNARNGDVMMLHYSGHGSNVPDDDGDEAGSRDEIICPTDLDWKEPIRDDWLRKTFDQLCDKQVGLTVVMDCCRSGTNTRTLLLPDAMSMPRYLPNPWDLMAEESGRALTGKMSDGLHRSLRSKRKRSDVVHADIPEMLITGCRDTQMSADAYIDNNYNGALTYYLVQSIKDAEGQISYRRLHARAANKIRRNGFDQVPQLEGLRDRFSEAFMC